RDYALGWTAFQQSRHPLYMQARDYWLKRAADMPPAPQLPLAAHLTPAIEAPLVSRRVQVLTGHEWGLLKERSVRAGLTPSAVITSAFVDVLAIWSRLPRFTIGLIGSYRPPVHPQINSIVGNFLTRLPLVIEPCFESFLNRTRQMQAQIAVGLAHQHFSGF